MDLGVYDWLLLGLLALTIILVCWAAGAYYGYREPLEEPIIAPARAVQEPEHHSIYRPSRHSQEDRGLRTQQLNGKFPPKIFPEKAAHPRDLD